MTRTTAEDRLSNYVTLLLAVSAIAGALAGWASTRISASTTELLALTAQTNRDQGLILSEAQTTQHYSVYAYYSVYETLREGLQQTLAQAPDNADLGAQQQQLQELTTLAQTTRFFFPGRYLQPDGSYADERERAEQLAEFAVRQDIDPSPYTNSLQRRYTKQMAYRAVLVMLSLALGCFTFFKLFDPQRRAVRFASVGMGVLLLSASIALTILIEFQLPVAAL